MKPVQLKLFEKARELQNRKVSVVAFAGESHVVQFLLLAIASCVCLYLYFVGVSILNVISNREASLESERLQSLVGSLEEDYFALAQAVTPEVGAQMGLTATKDMSFVKVDRNFALNTAPSEL